MLVIMMQIKDIVVVTETTVKLNMLNFSQMQFVIMIKLQDMQIVIKLINVNI